jgi:uncharacterized protein
MHTHANEAGTTVEPASRRRDEIDERPRPDGVVRAPTSGALLRRYGPTALVTGASEGIGRAFAVALARHGFELVLVARSEDRLRTLAAELATAFGATVHVVPADLSLPGATRALVEAQRGRSIGLVVAAAGFGSVGAFLEKEIDAESGMVDLNCRSVVELAHGFGGRMADAGRGGIVLFGSLVGFSGAPRSATYAATKGFVQGFAEGLAVELRPHGVDVLSVAPGPVASGFATRAGMRLDFSQTPATVAAGALAAIGRTTTVRPGALSKLLGWSLGMLPRRGRVRVLGQLMKGLTAAPTPAGPVRRAHGGR